jgi:hypothetical protein
MMFENLNDDNFQLFAAKAYEKPNAVMSEFEEDLNRILYLKRLLTKFYSSKILKDRLIMNHIIVLYNVFGIETTTRMLFYKLDNRDLEVLKPFLIFLNLLPDVVYGINGKNIMTADIKLDQEAVRCLRNIK